MAKSDFKQIGFTAPRDTDISLYTADMNSAYGAIESLQETLTMKTEIKTIALQPKPYYVSGILSQYRYYELSISNYGFLADSLVVNVDGIVQETTAYKIIQNNAILFTTNLTSSNVVTVTGKFLLAQSTRLESIEKANESQADEIEKIKNGATVTKHTEKTNQIKTPNGTFKELATALLEMVYPVGSIYMSAYNNDPATFLGGEWIPWGAGKVPVGVNTSDPDFATPEYSDGHKTKTLSVEEMPSHTHQQNPHNHAQGAHTHNFNYERVNANNLVETGENLLGNYYVYLHKGLESTTQTTHQTTAANSPTTATNQNTGGGKAFSILQPYITCYMFKRTN